MRTLHSIITTAALLSGFACMAQDLSQNDRSVYNGFNIVSFAPIQITENGFGLGVAYEKFIDQSGMVSLSVPAILTFNPSTNEQTGAPTMDPMVYLQPGIKIYTNMNGYSRVKWALGPNLVIGSGYGRLTNTYSNPVKYDPYIKRNRLLLGAMATISGNLFIQQYLYLGFDYSLGVSYLDSYDGVNMGIIPLTQLGFRIGYRYQRHPRHMMKGGNMGQDVPHNE